MQCTPQSQQGQAYARSLFAQHIGADTNVHLQIETGIPITDIDGIVAAIVIFNLVAALLPATGTLQLPEEEFEERAPGALQDPKISLACVATVAR
jgi:hypothetical protein